MRGTAARQKREKLGSYPAAQFEPNQRQDGAQRDQGKCVGIAPRPVIFRYAFEVHSIVKDRHRSREFIEFLKILDAAYPAATAIKVILDNHSAHISRETKTWLAVQPDGRFAFVFTPKHGSWLNLVEGFFSKAARSVLRHIRVNSTHELKQRIIEFINDLNRDPVIHRWRYKIDLPA